MLDIKAKLSSDLTIEATTLKQELDQLKDKASIASAYESMDKAREKAMRSKPSIGTQTIIEKSD
jgi:hypothetical protein